MRRAVAVSATIGGAFVAGAAAGTLATHKLEGLAAGIGVVLLLGPLALAFAGLCAFKRRDRRR
jgi:hypothetical protein